MNKHFSQQGSAHVVVVICLVLALLTSLGWIFYQNFIYKESTKVEGDSTIIRDTLPKVSYLQGKTQDDFGKALTFEYPSNWKVINSKNEVNDGNSDKKILQNLITEIVSPDEKYSVRYNLLKNGGLGGACDPEYAGTIATASHQQLDNFKEAYLIDMTTKDGNKYSRGVQLMNTKDVKSGASVCTAYLRNIITIGSLQEDDTTYEIVVQDASIQAKDAEGVTGKESLDKVFSGEDYEAAKKILLSTSVE